MQDVFFTSCRVARSATTEGQKIVVTVDRVGFVLEVELTFVLAACTGELLSDILVSRGTLVRSAIC